MLNFYDQFCLGSNFKGGHFYEKNSNFFKLGSQSVGRFHQMGTCQAAKKGLTKNFHFEFKIQIEQGHFYKKMLRSKVTIDGISPTAHGLCR
jgi:hypothetical protein